MYVFEIYTYAFRIGTIVFFSNCVWNLTVEIVREETSKQDI